METTDTFISFGDAVKTLSRDGDLATVGARGVIFGHRGATDLSGDWFTAKTYFGAQRGVGVDMMLNHGIPMGETPALKAKLAPYADILLPPVKATELDDDGLLYETVFNLKDKYQKRVYKMVEDGLLSSSSGAIAHAVRREGGAKSGEVKRWIIGEMSLTPHPCEFRLGDVAPIKSLMADGAYEPDSMRAAIKSLTDESFSLNVPLSLKSLQEIEGDDADLFDDEIKKYDENQPRDEGGKWSVVRGHSVSIHGTKVSEKHIHLAAQRFGLSGHAENALLKAHKSGKIVTDDHLMRTIATAVDAHDTTHASKHHGIFAAAAELHGVGGTHEGRVWDGKKPAKKSHSEADDSLEELEAAFKKYDENQPRDEGGKWSIIRGQSHSIAGKKVSESDIHKISDDLELSGHARNALLKAHRDGVIQNDGHLLRTIASADDAMNSGHSSSHHAIIAAAAELHGVGGTHEGKPWNNGGDTRPTTSHVEKKRASTRKSYDEADNSIDFDEDETKHIFSLESRLPDGLTFNDHSTKVLAAAEEFAERVEALATKRCVDGRRWSAGTFSLLNELAGGLQAQADEIKAIADAHAPKGSEVESEHFDEEIDALEISFLQQQERLLGMLPLGNQTAL